jgi:hypothetical protein
MRHKAVASQLLPAPLVVPSTMMQEGCQGNIPGHQPHKYNAYVFSKRGWRYIQRTSMIDPAAPPERALQGAGFSFKSSDGNATHCRPHNEWQYDPQTHRSSA